MAKRVRKHNLVQFVAGEMDSAEVVGNRLFKIRFVASYGARKQKLFAVTLGFEYDSYNNWELGKIMCPISAAVTVCEWTEDGVSLDYIYRGRLDLMGPGWALRLRAAPDRPGFVSPTRPSRGRGRGTPSSSTT